MTKSEEMILKACGRMNCARCNAEYPFAHDYWPSTTYAVCWICHLKDVEQNHRAQLFGALLAGAAVGALVAQIVAWLV